jgi:S1-C subfamily serine protease
MKRKTLLISIVLAILLAVAGCAPTSTPTSVPPSMNSTTDTGTLTATPVSSTSFADIEAALENIFAEVSPSVVNITVVEKPATTFSQIPGFSLPEQTPQQALGSGFVWDTTGDIVTNNHVIENADKITVTFYDGTTVSANLAGADADSDLAVVKVNMPAGQLKPIQVMDSSGVKVGQMAVAIGNPFGLQNTMTVGIVSGLGRLVSASESTTGPSYSIPDIIQTDASINPGNSGGVLLDGSGKLIGVTQSIATTSGTSSGVGFAIPSAIVLQVVPSLISTGHYDHPYLGVSIMSMDPDIAAAMNLPTNQRGALVGTVTAGSPADKAGIKAGEKQITINGQQISVGGDVIIKYNDLVVKSSDDVVTFLARYGEVGQNITLTLLRNGQQIQVTCTITARPSS